MLWISSRFKYPFIGGYLGILIIRDATVLQFYQVSFFLWNYILKNLTNYGPVPEDYFKNRWFFAKNHAITMYKGIGSNVPYFTHKYHAQIFSRDIRIEFTCIHMYFTWISCVFFVRYSYACLFFLSLYSHEIRMKVFPLY